MSPNTMPMAASASLAIDLSTWRTWGPACGPEDDSMNGSFSVDGAFRQRTMGRPASAGARQATLVLLQWADQRPPICYSVYKKGRVSKRSCHAKRDDARTAAAVGR